MPGSHLEKYTYEYLLDNSLNKVSDEFDKRPGSIIYDTIAPSCYQLAEFYMFLRNIYKDLSINSAYGEFLDNKVAEQGLSRYKATKAIKIGSFKNNLDTSFKVPIGSRFSTIDTINNENLNYIVIDTFKDEDGNLIDGNYLLQCEKYGSIGNDYVGDLIPISNIDNLKSAQLRQNIYFGRDDETDDELRKRYLNHVRKSSTSGNVYDYERWTKSVSGVGDCKIIPLWNGPGTVKIIIVDSNKHQADATLIKNVFNYIETVRPIGASITVESASNKVINISANLCLANDYSIDIVTETFKNNFEKYLKNIAFNSKYISIAKIGSLLLGTNGVLDYTDLKINDSFENIPINDTDIPISGIIKLVI